MRVLLADDQSSVRSALRLLLDEESRHRVVHEVSDARRLPAAIVTSRPEVLLFDWELPGLSAARFLAAARRRWPALGLVAMSSLPEARDAALAAGADGFLAKTDPPERVLALLAAIGQMLARRAAAPTADRPAHAGDG